MPPGSVTSLRKLLLVAAIVVLLVLADVGARKAAEAQLERRLERSIPSSTATSARIDSFPFLGQLLATGQVPAVTVGVRDVRVGRLRFASIVVELHDVHLDRDRLVRHSQVQIRSIGRGTAVGEVTQADLAAAIGVPVTLQQGHVVVQVRGVRASLAVTVQDNQLRLGLGPVSISPFKIPKAPLLPCVTDAEVLPGRVRLTCSVDQVPIELLRSLTPKNAA